MKMIETPTTAISDNVAEGRETGRKYWDAYDIARRKRPPWHAVLAFFGLRVER